MPVQKNGATAPKNQNRVANANASAPAATQAVPLFPAKLLSINETPRLLWTNAQGKEKYGHDAIIEFQLGDEMIKQPARVYDTTFEKVNLVEGNTYSFKAEEYQGNLYFTMLGEDRGERLSADQMKDIVGLKTVQLRATPRVRQAAAEVTKN